VPRPRRSPTPFATPRPRPRRKATNDRRRAPSQTATNRKNYGVARPRFFVRQRQVRQPKLRQGETTLPARDEVSNQSRRRMPLVSKNLDVVTSPLERLRRARVPGTSMRGSKSVQTSRARASRRETTKAVQKIPRRKLKREKARERRRAPPPRPRREEKKYTQIDRETLSLVKENTRKEPSLHY
jgi:hypothetical protein